MTEKSRTYHIPKKSSGIAGTITKLIMSPDFAKVVLAHMPPCKTCGHAAAAHEDETCRWQEAGAASLQAQGIEPDWCECTEYVNSETFADLSDQRDPKKLAEAMGLPEGTFVGVDHGLGKDESKTVLVEKVGDKLIAHGGCPKCGATNWYDWSQCNGECPIPGSPHFKPEEG
jgi:ribosomal protein L32